MTEKGRHIRHEFCGFKKKMGTECSEVPELPSTIYDVCVCEDASPRGSGKKSRFEIPLRKVGKAGKAAFGSHWAVSSC